MMIFPLPAYQSHEGRKRHILLPYHLKDLTKLDINQDYKHYICITSKQDAEKWTLKNHIFANFDEAKLCKVINEDS